MRFLITAGPGARTSEEAMRADATIDERLITAYMKFNEEMHKAGVLVASEGLLPDGARARIGVANGKRTVLDGPFTEAKELLGGLYLIDVPSKEEAISWALRCPVGMATAEVLEVLQMTDIADLPREVIDLIERASPTWSAAQRRPK